MSIQKDGLHHESRTEEGDAELEKLFKRQA